MARIVSREGDLQSAVAGQSVTLTLADEVDCSRGDVIEEFDYADLYAPVDLEIGHCRLSLAEPREGAASVDGASHVRVATKYPGLTRRQLRSTPLRSRPSNAPSRSAGSASPTTCRVRSPFSRATMRPM